MRRRNWTIPYALFLAIFVVTPLLLIVLYAFTDADGTLLQGTKVRLEDEKGNMFGTAGFDMKSEHPVVYHFVDGVLDSDGNEPAIESPNHYEIWRKGLIEKVWTDGGDTIEYWEKGVPVRIETNVIQRRKNGEPI